MRYARIHDAVAAVFEASNEVYGSAKIARTLETDPDLETACRNTVAKAMREMALIRLRKPAAWNWPTLRSDEPKERP